MVTERIECKLWTIRSWAGEAEPQIGVFCHLYFLRYSPEIFKLKVTTVRSKVKSRSDHDVAHLHPLTNVPTKYELQPGQTFSRRPPTRSFAHPDTIGESNTPTALKGCGVKRLKCCNWLQKTCCFLIKNSIRDDQISQPWENQWTQ